MSSKLAARNRLSEIPSKLLEHDESNIFYDCAEGENVSNIHFCVYRGEGILAEENKTEMGETRKDEINENRVLLQSSVTRKDNRGEMSFESLSSARPSCEAKRMAGMFHYNSTLIHPKLLNNLHNSGCVPNYLDQSLRTRKTDTSELSKSRSNLQLTSPRKQSPTTVENKFGKNCATFNKVRFVDDKSKQIQEFSNSKLTRKKSEKLNDYMTSVKVSQVRLNTSDNSFTTPGQSVEKNDEHTTVDLNKEDDNSSSDANTNTTQSNMYTSQQKSHRKTSVERSYKKESNYERCEQRNKLKPSEAAGEAVRKTSRIIKLGKSDVDGMNTNNALDDNRSNDDTPVEQRSSYEKKKIVNEIHASREQLHFRMNLLLSWNTLQLVFLILMFLYASMCKCVFKAVFLEQRRCIKREVQ